LHKIDTGRRRTPRPQLHKLRHRRHAATVEQEQHVVSRWSDVPVGRAGHGQRSAANREVQSHHALIKPESVTRCAISNQGHRGNTGCVWRLYGKGVAITDSRRCAADGRPRGQRSVRLEQVCRLINLHVRFVGATRGIAPGKPHGGVREQKRYGVIQARVYIRSGRGKCIGIGIVEIRIQTLGTSRFIGDRPPHCQNLAARQNHSIHLDSRLGHGGARHPLRACRSQIDKFRGGGGRVVSAENHYFRVVVVRRRQRQQHRAAIGPRLAVNGGGDVLGKACR